ncbi:import component protein [Pedobacter steynii]|uniref:Import component protein n=1 Tax=Pedobacter steynii TaxID=430522 RepID=A0A1D7QJ78_9SPHI|nr:import component protein [Pedobacter steynii]AOM78725.1 import component protein [Pedobacter steynii]
MKNKTMAVLAYITIIGWIVAYLEYKKSTEQSKLVNYHLGQALGIFLSYLLISILGGIILSLIPALAIVFYVALFIPLILLLFGVITALNEVERPVPLIGKLFEGKFNFSAKTI